MIQVLENLYVNIIDLLPSSFIIPVLIFL